MTDAEAAFLKANLLDLVAGGETLHDACRALGIGWRDLARWKRGDSEFLADLRDAEAHLADYCVAKALQAHTELDPKAAMVAIRSHTWAAERLAPDKYGSRIEVNDKASTGELLKVLQAAVERLQVHQGKTVDVTPAAQQLTISSKPKQQEEQRRP